MKDSMKLTLAQLGTFALVAVRFTEYGKTYCYKTRDFSIEPGDRVVVQVPVNSKTSDQVTQAGGLTVVTVDEMVANPDIDPDSGFSYKWIVSKVDTTAYDHQHELEMQALDEMRRIRRERARSEAVEQIQQELFGGQFTFDNAPALSQIIDHSKTGDQQ